MLEKDRDDKYPLFRVNISVTVQFQAMIEQFGLTQHVDESTRGWVDLILTRYGCSLFHLCFRPPHHSDHGLVAAAVYRFFTTCRLILPNKSDVGGISTGVRSVWRYSILQCPGRILRSVSPGSGGTHKFGHVSSYINI